MTMPTRKRSQCTRCRAGAHDECPEKGLESTSHVMSHVVCFCECHGDAGSDLWAASKEQL